MKHLSLQYSLYLILLMGTSLHSKTPPEVNLIDEIVVTKNRIDIKINVGFKKKFLKGDFYATYDQNLDLSKLDNSLNVLPFVSNIISIIWISGRTYYIDSLDQEFHESLKTVKEVFRRMYPETKWNGELIPRKLIKNSYIHRSQRGEKERTALLFSGGLDSITSSLYHKEKKQLLVTVNGHWDLPLWDKHLLKERKKDLLAWGTKYGHENSFIDSNYYDFLNRPVLDTYSHEITSWRIYCVEGIGWAGLAAPLMALKGYPVLLHGSTITWEYNFPACANPFIDDNIFFGGMRLKHDLFDMHRLEKCEYIANLCRKESIERPFIRVCEEKTVNNCNACQKCIRTIIELVIADENPRDYGFNCDVEKVLKDSKEFMEHHGTGSTTVWHFMHIQKRLQEKVARGRTIPESLSWLLTVNLKKKLTSELKNQHKLDWRNFIDLLPDIKVPDRIEPAF